MSNKNWQIAPAISEKFRKKYPQYGRLVLQLLFNRGLVEEKDIESFLNPDFNVSSFDPFLFNDMRAAVDLIIRHIKNGNKTVVYGDYDADGVTASAIMFDILSTLKGNVDVYIPNRVTEGYGLNKNAIKKIADSGVKLIITVDGGIRNKEEVEYAKKLGLDVVITDHHLPPKDSPMGGLPPCLIINPMVGGEKYPFKFLSGAGAAFKVAQAIIRSSTLAGEDKQKMEERLLDLAAIGTVADCVSLLGENRVLVKKGLVIMGDTKRMGLKELIKIARGQNNLNGEKKIDAWHIGFQIGPRLNAAGRMGHANTAFELLTTKIKEEAETLARDLNDKNIDRQRMTEEIMAAAEKQVGNDKDRIIIAVYPETVSADAWNEGVIGLVAGKLSDKYYKPALVITKNDDGYKGSGRSIEEFNIMEAMEACAGWLEKFGGHKAACGFSLSENKLDGFVKKIKEVAEKKLTGEELMPKLKIETEIDLAEVNEELVGEIEKFAPFGEGNARPKFLSRGAAIVDIAAMGLTGQHIKLRIKNANSPVLSAVGFWQAEAWQDLQIGDKIDIVYHIEMNEFNGRREAQLKIIDIKRS